MTVTGNVTHLLSRARGALSTDRNRAQWHALALPHLRTPPPKCNHHRTRRYMAVIWLLHGCYMAVAWLLHGCYMAAYMYATCKVLLRRVGLVVPRGLVAAFGFAHALLLQFRLQHHKGVTCALQVRYMCVTNALSISPTTSQGRYTGVSRALQVRYKCVTSALQVRS